MSTSTFAHLIRTDQILSIIVKFAAKHPVQSSRYACELRLLSMSRSIHEEWWRHWADVLRQFRLELYIEEYTRAENDFDAQDAMETEDYRTGRRLDELRDEFLDTLRDDSSGESESW